MMTIRIKNNYNSNNSNIFIKNNNNKLKLQINNRKGNKFYSKNRIIKIKLKKKCEFFIFFIYRYIIYL